MVVAAIGWKAAIQAKATTAHPAICCRSAMAMSLEHDNWFVGGRVFLASSLRHTLTQRSIGCARAASFAARGLVFRPFGDTGPGASRS